MINTTFKNFKKIKLFGFLVITITMFYIFTKKMILFKIIELFLLIDCLNLKQAKFLHK